MNRIIALIVFLQLGLLFATTLFSQKPQRKSLTALRTHQPLKIDGILDEAIYDQAQIAGDFVQLQPYNGRPSYQASEVKVLYDDFAIYVGAMLYDHPDSITSYTTTRDNVGVSDYFVFFLDPNNEGLLSYEFLVTPANSQTDLKGIRNTYGDYEDANWNAVWQSATQIVETGWTVEMRIPYSALRFPVKDDMVWGVNFFRNIRRHNSNNSWNLIDVNVSGFLHQSGQLYGLNNIKPPLRLSLTPYVAQYVELKTGDEDFIFKGGLDLKYGISESHTLDLMLIPDFGQIQSDDQQLNLSPYELYYDEKRQFFIEGNELFERGGIFYSRRIGAQPKFSDLASENLQADEKLTYNPSATQLINATKLTGRDKNGWGIGMMNAMTLPSEALIENEKTGKTRAVLTQPFTNYNVMVVEKSMRNNSYISFINTNLSMVNNPYNSNVTATQFQLKNKKQSYQLLGVGGLSHKSVADEKTGFGYKLGLSKINGNIRFNAERNVFSNALDINDMGYLQRNNVEENSAQVSYQINDPFSIFKNIYSHIEWENERLYKPSNHVGHEFSMWNSATFKNNWWAGLYYGYQTQVNDFFEPRSSNHRMYLIPAYHSTELNINTDRNKKISLNGNFGMYFMDEPGRWGNWSYGNIWWKASSKLNISYSCSFENENNAKGYVEHNNNDSIYFSTYWRETFVNTLSVNYFLNTKAGFEFRGRHYRSIADYENLLFFLEKNGSLSPDKTNNNNPDVNFNAFNIDMIFKWEFAPGSEISIAWKNAIYTEDEQVGLKNAENFSNTLRADQINSISIKLLYYIDINSAISKNRN